MMRCLLAILVPSLLAATACAAMPLRDQIAGVIGRSIDDPSDQRIGVNQIDWENVGAVRPLPLDNPLVQAWHACEAREIEYLELGRILLLAGPPDRSPAAAEAWTTCSTAAATRAGLPGWYAGYEVDRARLDRPLSGAFETRVLAFTFIGPDAWQFLPAGEATADTVGVRLIVANDHSLCAPNGSWACSAHVDLPEAGTTTVGVQYSCGDATARQRSWQGEPCQGMPIAATSHLPGLDLAAIVGNATYRTIDRDHRDFELAAACADDPANLVALLIGDFLYTESDYAFVDWMECEPGTSLPQEAFNPGIDIWTAFAPDRTPLLVISARNERVPDDSILSVESLAILAMTGTPELVYLGDRWRCGRLGFITGWLSDSLCP